MESKVEGAPAFAYVTLTLQPGETVLLEPDAMTSMGASIALSPKLNGGFFGGLMRKFLAKESIVINHYQNNGPNAETLVFTQPTPGEIKHLECKDSAIELQPGGFIGATEGIKLKLKWAGFISWFAGMGLFRLQCFGTGSLWFGAYGGIVYKSVKEPLIIDNDHLVAVEPGVTLKPKLAGGIFSSMFGGEGIVIEAQGEGRVAIQTRSLPALASWTNSKIA